MVMKGSQSIDDVLIPRGIIIAYPISAGVVSNDGIDLGFCMETDLKIIDAVKNRYSARDAEKSKIYERVVRTDYSIGITCISSNEDNFAMIRRQEKTTEVQAGSYYTFAAPQAITAPAVLDRAKQLTYRHVHVTELKYDGGTGLFAAGQIVTGAGGATGKIAFVDGIAASGSLWLVDVAGTFIDDEAITDPLVGVALANGTQSVKEDIVLLNNAKTVKYTKDTDYGIEHRTGTIFFFSGVTIVAAAALHAIYDYATLSETTIKKGSSGISYYEVHILPQNDDGPLIEWIFYNCAIHTDTTVKLISEGDGDVELSIILTPVADGPNATDDYPYFRERFLTE